MKEVSTAGFGSLNEKSRKFVEAWTKRIEPVINASPQEKLETYFIEVEYSGKDYKEVLKEDVSFFQKVFRDNDLETSKKLLRRVAGKSWVSDKIKDIFPQAIILDWHRVDERNLLFVVLCVPTLRTIASTFYNPAASASIVYILRK